MMTTTATPAKTVRIGFRRGLNQVRYGDYPAIRAKLFTALGIGNRNSFYNYANGVQELKVTQADQVEEVFRDYGITEIWGNDEDKRNT